MPTRSASGVESTNAELKGRHGARGQRIRVTLARKCLAGRSGSVEAQAMSAPPSPHALNPDTLRELLKQLLRDGLTDELVVAEVMHDHAMASVVLQVDDTGLNVLDRESPGGKVRGCDGQGSQLLGSRQKVPRQGPRARGPPRRLRHQAHQEAVQGACMRPRCRTLCRPGRWVRSGTYG